MQKLWAVLLVASWTIGSSAGQIYWTETDGDGGMIRRANADGSGVVTVMRGLDAAIGIAVDETEGKLYWTEVLAGEIWRADLNGGNRERIVSSLWTPIDVVVDPMRDRVYWTDHSLQQIGAAPRSGGVPETVMPDIYAAEGLALDAAEGILYWATLDNAHGALGSIDRFDLDSDQRAVVVTGSMPWGLAIDGDSDRLYWSQVGDASTRECNADGSGAVTLLGPHAPSELPDFVANGLTFDSEHDVLYFENGADHTGFGLYSLSLDTGQPKRIVDTGIVGDLTYTSLVVPEPSAIMLFSMASLGAWALLVRRRYPFRSHTCRLAFSKREV